MRRVTYSRNFTISLSRTCRCYCKYCAFATHQPDLRSTDEVERLLDRAVRKRAKELLILTGEAPHENVRVAERLKGFGHGDFVDYVVWVCERALERGLLPHTNIGVLDRDEMLRLREVTASQGLMLESVSERLMATVHAGSPSKHPRRRLEAIELAGELKIPFTTGLLLGIGETAAQRSEALLAIAELNDRYGHVQELIVQNFVPHPRYHGEDVGEIAGDAAEALWRTGMAPGGGRADSRALPDWASPVSLEEMAEVIAEARELMPGAGIQVPPNLADWWPRLVAAGATDLGGLSANGDHVSPELPFPSPKQVRTRLAEDGVALGERLCAYPRYLNGEWISAPVLDTITERYWSFIPRGERRRAVDAGQVDAGYVSEAIETCRSGAAPAPEQLTALFAETRPELIERIRAAADELRIELAGDEVSFIVNRNVNFTNICTVGCAFCGFGQSSRAAGAFEIEENHFRAKVAEAVDFGATEVCMQGGIHPQYELADYGRWLSIAKDVAPDIHLHAFSPMEISYMCDRSGRTPREIFGYLKECGLDSTPGTAAEILEDGVRTRISPNKLPVARWVEIVEAAHAIGLPTTATVMFGHIEEPWELAEHMRIVRELQERSLQSGAGSITEFVPLSFVPYQTLLGRTHGLVEISRDENLKHTAVFRLALGATVRNLQASWVKMGLKTATESLRWGVNDLGGTLMEESISRTAGSQHGSRMEPEDLIGAAHDAGRTAVQRDTTYGARIARHPIVKQPARQAAAEAA